LELDRSSNRLSFALIIAAIIVGSSLIMTIDVGIKIYGIPAVGLLGYLFAGILGAGLAISILRSGRL
jgi:ubiquinone biosynthesis protein